MEKNIKFLDKLRKIKMLYHKSVQILKIFYKGDGFGLKYRSNLTLRNKLFCLKRGFKMGKYDLYNFKENDSRDYVSDIYDTMTIPKNGFYHQLIDNKAFLPIILKTYSEYVPAYYFTLYKPKILDHLNNRYIDNNEFLNQIHILLEKKGKIVLKPLSMEGGMGFILLSKNENRLSINNKDITENDLNIELLGLNNYICTEHVTNADQIRNIYPYSCNTIRVLTIWDDEENRPFVARALHRFGSNPQKTVDNILSGGVSSEIDVKTGTMSHLYLWTKVKNDNFSDIHPETKMQVSGIKIDNWEAKISKLVEIATSMPHMKYMGWDIALTEDAFKVLEINSNPDIDLFQVHRPLLIDNKVRNFFDKFKDQKPVGYFYRK